MAFPRYEKLVSVVHQGIAVVFGSRVVNGVADISYNVLGLNVDSESDATDWTGFKKLTFPTEVRPAGMSVVTLSAAIAGVAPDATKTFRVVTDQRRISVIVPSNRDTLLISRFVLVKTSSGPKGQTTDYDLNPVWEVRFERSGKQSIPADQTDPQTYVSGDGTPFIEPMVELAMVDGVGAGAFGALFLPIQDSAALNWQFIVANATTGKIDLYNFPSDGSGLPDLSDKTINDKSQIAPDASFAVTDQGGTALALQYAPATTLYMKHETAVSPTGDGMTVKRVGRVLIAIAADRGESRVTFLLDAAVSQTGQMAAIGPTVAASRIEPANYALTFDEVAYVALVNRGEGDNPLAIRGAYAIDLWVSPSAVGDHPRLIVGGKTDAPPESRAPYLQITRDLRLEMGFGDGDKPVSFRTDPIEWQIGAWYHLLLTYSDTDPEPFALQVNGNMMPLTGTAAPGKPSGQPITRISANADAGFVGQIDAVKITVAQQAVCDLPFDTVDYDQNPRVTPNLAATSIVAEVYGTKLRLSASPQNVNTNGTFNIDADGLTWYAGYADFVQPATAPDLLDGSDAVLHLYFQDKGSNTFSVAQYSTLTQRAVFGLQWSTRVLVQEGEGQDDTLRLIAHAPGTQMNEAQIRVTDAPDARLCQTDLTDPIGGYAESWKGLPRSATNYALALNGLATNDPSNQDLLNGAKIFFDYGGTYPQVVVPSSTVGDGGLYQFVSRLPAMAPLTALAIGDGSRSDLATLTMVNKPGHWTADQAVISHVWPDVARRPADLTQTLAGTRSGYAYDQITSPDTAAYGLIAGFGTDSQTRLIVYVHKAAIETLELVVANAASTDHCTVTVNGFELPDVPRNQQGFAGVLNGTDPDYDYPDNYKTQIAANVYVLTNGLNAAVRNTGVGGAQPASPLVFSNLVRAFYDGDQYDAGSLTNLPQTTALILQSARGTQGGETRRILGSGLVSAVFETPPTSGATALIANTDVYSAGIAPLLVNGAVGGWIQEPPNFSLGFNAPRRYNHLRFKAEQGFIPLEALSIPGDLTIETWMNPTGPTDGRISRLFTLSSVGNKDYPELPFRYLLGAKQGPALNVADNTFAQRAYSYPPPETTLQLFVKVTSEAFQGVLAGVLPVRVSDPFLAMGLNSLGRPYLAFMGEIVLTSATALTQNRWTMLTATLSAAEGGGTNVSLYIDDGAPETETVTGAFTENLGVLQLGTREAQSLAFSANGVSMWRVCLSPAQVRDTYVYDYADNSSGLLIRWNCTEGTGTDLRNAAASGPDYDADVTNPGDPAWDDDGLYQVPYAGRNDLVFEAGAIARNWTHVALIYRQGRGIALDGNASGSVKDGSNLNASAQYSLECAIRPAGSGTARVLVAKDGCYQLRLDSQNRAEFSTTIDVGGRAIAFRAHSAPIAMDQTHSIACTFDSGAVDQDAPPGERVYPKYFAEAKVYVDGAISGTPHRVDDYTDSVKVVTSSSTFLVGKSVDDDFYYRGLLSDLRLWQRVLADTEIRHGFIFNTLPKNVDGLSASWDFRQDAGKVAFDQQGNNDITLSSNELWALFEDIAQVDILVDGRAAPLSPLSIDAVGGYGDRQLTIGALIKDGSPTLPFQGSVDELRIWSTMLTPEQVGDSMFRTLDGRSDGLAGYWTFETGSGLEVYDQTGRGNNGTFVPADVTSGPQWQTSTAPISTEAAPVLNVLNGVRTEFTSTLQGVPAVFEYSDTQTDAYGKAFAVLKRGYVYNPDASGDTVLLTGYKVGDLDLIYIGQVQTAPKIVGYIEGGPPIPSENQTVAYWAGPPGTPNPFGSASSVTLSEARDTTWSFSANQTISGSFDISGKLGVIAEGKFDNSNGQFTFFGMDLAKYEVKGGAKLGLAGSKAGATGIGSQHGTTHAKTSQLAPAGAWEPADDMLNPVVGRRYVQDNVGTAFVKSSTANLYMEAIKGTQTAVKYTLIADPSIPEDVNIIDFPINPRYVKNGTLDGKVGFKNDPDWPDADVRRGSYFNPTEAYALKRESEKQDQELKAYYEQFNVDLLSLYPVLDPIRDKMDDAPGFDRSTGTIQRSLANTYVWSAAGGVYKEEYGTIDQFSESRSGTTSLTLNGGVEIEAKATGPAGGFYASFDSLLSTSIEMTVSRNSATSYAYALTASADPTGFLRAPIIEIEDGSPVLKGYTDGSAPGKVDTYRYMTFFLSPSKANFDQLSRVIDPNWLQTSAQANAAALREATESENGTWRVLYRTTFVSRVPMEFQPINSDTLGPEIDPPANLAENSWIIQIVEQQIPEPQPTPLQIGRALDATLGTAPDQTGILGTLLPWWPGFLAAAQVFGSEEYRQLVILREDLLGYMTRFYEAGADAA